MLEQLLEEVPSGVERADVLFALVWTFRADSSAMIELSDEALVEAAGDDARSARILALRAWNLLLRADVRAGARRCPDGSGKGRACRRARADRRGDRTGGSGGNMGARRSRPACSSEARRWRSASGSRSSIIESPRVCARPHADPSGGDRASPCDLRGAGEEGSQRAATRGRGGLILWSLSRMWSGRRPLAAGA